MMQHALSRLPSGLREEGCARTTERTGSYVDSDAL